MEQKPQTYLQQVFNSTFFTLIMGVLFLALLYTASLLLFAKWEDYSDPVGSKGNAIGVFVVCLVVLAVAFLVPLFKKDHVLARRTQSEIEYTEDVPEFRIGDYVSASIGPKGDRRSVEALVVSVYPENGSLKYSVRPLDQKDPVEVFAYQVSRRG